MVTITQKGLLAFCNAMIHTAPYHKKTECLAMDRMTCYQHPVQKMMPRLALATRPSLYKTLVAWVGWDAHRTQCDF